MDIIRKLLIWCVFLVLMEKLRVSEGAPWCCVHVLCNRSVRYTLNTTGCRDNIWTLNNTSIKDENGDKDDAVIDSGPNWILLNRNYSGVQYVCIDPDNQIHTPVQCTDPCDSRKFHSQTEVCVSVTGLSTEYKAAIISVIIIIIITIIIIIMVIIIQKTDCFRRSREDAANRHEANNANHANGGLQAVDQKESEV